MQTNLRPLLKPIFATAAGGIFGATFMYFADPKLGRRRRHEVTQKTRSRLHRAGCNLVRAIRDLNHRSRGKFLEMKHRIRETSVSDEVLVERVRSALGHWVSQPSKIEVISQDGCICLQGVIPYWEEAPLLHRLSTISGVREIDNQLVSASPTWDLGDAVESRPPANAPLGQYLIGGAGAALALASTRVRKSVGIPLAVFGSGLMVSSLLTSLLKNGGATNSIKFHKTIRLNAPIEKVYAFWNRMENFSTLLSHVNEVKTDGKFSHWIVDGPGGLPVHWDAETTVNIPNEIIAWKTVPNSAIEAEGQVKFAADPRGGTRVEIQLAYNPPGGFLGHRVASLFHADPKSQMDTDLLRVKGFLENDRRPTPSPTPGNRQAS